MAIFIVKKKCRPLIIGANHESYLLSEVTFFRHCWATLAMMEVDDQKGSLPNARTGLSWEKKLILELFLELFHLFKVT